LRISRPSWIVVVLAQSKIATPRKEDDKAEILSGVLDGLTLGTPIGILVRNTDQRPSAYTEMETAYCPSHADYTYDAKYGIRAVSGGGRSSARETIGRVAAGAIARKALQASLPAYDRLAFVKTVQHLEARDSCANRKHRQLMRDAVESNIVRTCDAVAAEQMIALIEKVRSEGNSVGGVDRVRGARCASRPWRARVRQAGSRSCKGHAEPSCDEGF